MAATKLKDRVVNPQGLRKQNLPYVFIWVVYYAWVIAFSTWWTASPLTENVFGTQMRSIMHVTNLLASAVFVFIIRKEWFVRTARIGALLIIAGMGSFLLVPDGTIQLAAALVIAVALGVVNISILMPFVFALNNTEKLYAVVGSNLLIGIISLFLEKQTGTGTRGSTELIFSFTLVLIALSAILYFKPDSVAAKTGEPAATLPRMQVWVYLTLVMNCVFAILCKGAGRGVLNIAAVNAGPEVLTWYCCGELAGCLIYLVVYAISRKCIHMAWNLTFGCMTMGLLLNAFSLQRPGLAIAFALLFGISGSMGMINMYYILGVIAEKYQSMRYLRLSILLIGICGGVSGVLIGSLITRIGTVGVSLTASIVSAFVILLFLIFSPAFAAVYYNGEWARDAEKIDNDNDKRSLFRQYRLSKRETEVCQLLLQGYTLRQISGILSLAYPTVNTYCTSVYRKLNINSRTELLILFRELETK